MVQISKTTAKTLPVLSLVVMILHNVNGQLCETNFDTNTQYHITARHSQKGLHIDDDSTNGGANPIQKTIGTGTSEEWKLVTSNTMGYYRLVNVNSGRELRVSGASQNAGTKLVQWSLSEVSHGNFCFQDVGDGYYMIELEHSQQVLHVSDASQDDGAIIRQRPYFGGQNQQFTLTSATSQTDSLGLWEGPYTMPHVPASAANLPDGRILTWSAAAKYTYGAGTGKTYTSIFDPVNLNSTDTLVSDTSHDMFCPGTTVLPDGRIVVSGGWNSRPTSIYNPANDTWTRGANLKIRRGYNTQTMLSDGSILNLGGSWSGTLGEDKDGEVWNVNTETWWKKVGIKSTGSLLTDDIQGVYRADNHMWLFVAPNDLVFQAGPSIQMHWIDTSGDGSVTPSIVRGDDDHAMNGNAVMFDIGKILTVGGAPNYASGFATNHSYVIDVNGGMGGVTVTRSGDMLAARTFHNSVVLPSGEVVVIGGMPTAQIFSDQDAVLFAEIWDPSTGQFTELASMAIPRTYHSFAILLKDGRVLSGGGGLCGVCTVNHDDVEIFTPPYLLNSDGTFKTRPEIVSAPTTAMAGEIFSVTMDTSGSHSFVLMRLGAVTHSVNTDARRIPLSSEFISSTQFDLTVPSNPAVALVGSYYLFAMNSDGVPSIGVIISLTG